MKNTEKLADFVRAVMLEKSLSTYDVQKASHNRITAATVTKIVNNEIKSSGVETLAALAVGLGVPEDNIFRVARGLPPDEPLDRFEIYAEAFNAADFTPDEWRIMEDYFREHVNKWKQLKAEHKKFVGGMEAWAEAEDKKHFAPVVARIEPGKKLKAVPPPRTINSDEIAEAERRIKPRKRKGA